MDYEELIEGLKLLSYKTEAQLTAIRMGTFGKLGDPIPVRFKTGLFADQELYLWGELDTHGPIATKEQYDNFEDSTAYLNPRSARAAGLSGIFRYNVKIGEASDLELLAAGGAK